MNSNIKSLSSSIGNNRPPNNTPNLANILENSLGKSIPTEAAKIAIDKLRSGSKPSASATLQSNPELSANPESGQQLTEIQSIGESLAGQITRAGRQALSAQTSFLDSDRVRNLLEE